MEHPLREICKNHVARFSAAISHFQFDFQVNGVQRWKFLIHEMHCALSTSTQSSQAADKNKEKNGYQIFFLILGIDFDASYASYLQQIEFFQCKQFAAHVRLFSFILSLLTCFQFALKCQVHKHKDDSIALPACVSVLEKGDA